MKSGADVLGMKVTTSSGRPLGAVADLLFDDECTRVDGIVAERRRVFRRHRVIPFEQVRTIGPMAVILTDGKPHHGARELRRPGAGNAMQGRPVVTAQGETVGAVRDVLFDEATGEVLGFEIAAGVSARELAGVAADATALAGGALVVGGRAR